MKNVVTVLASGAQQQVGEGQPMLHAAIGICSDHWLPPTNISDCGCFQSVYRNQSNIFFPLLSSAVFICSFMVAAPIFGYLGDRFNRKVILSCGIFFWSIVTLMSSFISKEVRHSSCSQGNCRTMAAGEHQRCSVRLLSSDRDELISLWWSGYARRLVKRNEMTRLLNQTAALPLKTF